MLQTVAKIVRVDGPGADPAQHSGETHRALIFDRGHSHEPVFRIGPPEVSAPSAEFVHVALCHPIAACNTSCNCATVRSAGTRPAGSCRAE